jgi:hypothetical protein
MQPPLADGQDAQDDQLLTKAEQGESSSKALATFLLAYNPTRLPARTRHMSAQHYSGHRIPVMSDSAPVTEEKKAKEKKPKKKTAKAAPKAKATKTEEEEDAEVKKPAKPKIEQTETYSIMMKTLLNANATSLRSEIASNFMLVDKTFLEELQRETLNEKNNETVRQRLTEVRQIVDEESTRMIQEAAMTLQELFASPSALVMEAKMASLANQGRVTNVLLELLDANLAQAKLAGEAGKNAVIGIGRLYNLTRVELDKKLSPIQAFFRKLLRVDDSKYRRDLIREKLRAKLDDEIEVPKKKLLLGGAGQEEKKDDSPKITSEIDQREFTQFLTDMKTRFGNVDEQFETGFVKRFNDICADVEAIALELSGGKRMTARQAQDKAMEESHVSVFDLEHMEKEARQDGKLAIWEEEAQAQVAKKDNAEREKSVKDVKLR